jgi:hypothetical protein
LDAGVEFVATNVVANELLKINANLARGDLSVPA